ncbi:MAG: hypothetical protein KDB88_05620 [Flavobacteriales bacterium]|nr:hypothetical protein [Flavobacteriales bacterium]
MPMLPLLLLIACGSNTHIVQSWRDPNVTIVDGSYNKVLVICLIKDEGTRRVGEDRMAMFMNGRGVESYRYLGPDVDAINDASTGERMRKDGIDGVVIMRLVDRTKEQTYVPGASYPAYYASPYGYYGYAYPMYATPGYVRTDVNYFVETNLYSTKKEGLIWTSTTSTLNPTDLGNSVEEVMQVVYDKMIAEGFIVKSGQ